MKELPVNQLICGDAFAVLSTFPKHSIDMVMFSPPYWGLRDYKIPKVADAFAVGGVGLESHPQAYIDRMVVLCRLLRRVLKKTGSMYLILGDTYFGGKGQSGRKDKNLEQRRAEGRTLQKREWTLMKQDAPQDVCKQDGKWLQPKQLLLMPSRLAIALQDDGWILRNDIVWHKPNHMPSSVKDRLTNSYEHIFHFVKARRYFYDLDAIRKPHKKSGDYKDYSGKIKTAPRSLLIGTRDYLGKPNHPLGKNPSDVIKIGMHHGSSLTKGRATHYEGQLIESDLKGKNPGDTITTKKWGVLPNPQVRVGHDKDYCGRDKALGKNPSDFLSIPTQPFPEAHFAVYPEKICRNPIKASCPAQICVKCGKPRKRKTKKSARGRKRSDPQPFFEHTPKEGSDRRRGFQEGVVYETVGWTDCGCGKGFEPGIVLDPMCGSGTTLVAAHKLGRRWIGIDLKPEYIEIARRRLEKAGAFSKRLSEFA